MTATSFQRTSTIIIIFVSLFLAYNLLLPSPFLSVLPAYAQESLSPDLLPVERGIRFLNENKLDEALKSFEEAIVQDPKDPLPHYYSGVVYHLMRKPLPALNSLNKALSLRPGMPDAILEIGIILEEVGRFDKAMEAYKAVAGGAEESPLTKNARERLNRLTVMEHSRKALRLYQDGHYNDSIQELQTLLSIDPENADAHFAMGMAYMKLRKLKDATGSFKKAMEINPGHLDAILQLGLIYDTLASYQEAIESYNKIVSIAPESPQAKEVQKRLAESGRKQEVRRRFEAAAEMIRKEAWDEALKETEAILAVEPDNPNALFNHGLVLHRLKQDDRAISSLRHAVEIDPKFYKGYYQLAVTYEDLVQYKEALENYEQAVAFGGDTEEGKKARERVELLKPMLDVSEKTAEVKELLQKEDIKGAIREMEGLLAVKGSDPNIFVSLATLYIREGRLKDAAAALEKALPLAPKDAKMRFTLAKVYEQLKEYGKAAESYNAVAELQKGTPEGEDALEKARSAAVRHHLGLAKKYIDKGDYESSLKELEEVLAITPDDPVALNNKGILYYRLNRPEDAEAPLRRAISLAPDYTAAYLQLGLTLERLRRFSDAREAFEKVIEIKADSREASIAKSRIEALKEIEILTSHLENGIKLMEGRDWEGARKEIEAIIGIDPRNYMGYYYMGIILDRAGVPDEAEKAFNKAIEINPNLANAYLSLGDLHLKNGEFKDARKSYEQVIAISKDSPEAEIAAERLITLRALTGEFSMSHNYNSNIAFGAKANAALNTSYGLGLRYALFREKEWDLATNLSYNQTIYYENQFSGNGYSLGLEWSRTFSGERYLSADVTSSKSYFAGEPSFRENQFSVLAKTEPRSIPTSASFSYRFSRGVSYSNKSSDAERHNLSLSVSQKVSLRNTLGGSYAFNIQKNLDPLGSNYANRTHTISANYNRSLWAGASGGLKYSLSLVNYSNPDSTAFYQQFRRNVSNVVGSTFNYRLSNKVSFSLHYSYTVNRTNLPRPTAEEQRKLEEILATPIPTVGGGYRQHNLTLSFVTTF